LLFPIPTTAPPYQGSDTPRWPGHSEAGVEVPEEEGAEGGGGGGPWCIGWKGA